MIDTRGVAWRTFGTALCGVVVLYRAFASEPFGEPNPGFDFNFWVGFGFFIVMCAVVARQAVRERK
jgi:hypothetical protein